MIKLSDKLYLFRNEKVEGPFTAFQLRELYRNGSVTLETKFAQEGDPKWHQLDVIKKTLEPAKSSKNVFLYIVICCSLLFALSFAVYFIVVIANLKSRQVDETDTQVASKSGPVNMADSYAASIRRVMAQHVTAKYNNGEKVESTQQMRDSLRKIYDNECKIDLQGCPGDFSEAYVRYKSALLVLHDDLPESTTQAFFDGMMRGLNGEADGGYSRLTAKYDQEFSNIKSLEAECEAIAARYGVTSNNNP